MSINIKNLTGLFINKYSNLSLNPENMQPRQTDIYEQHTKSEYK